MNTTTFKTITIGGTTVDKLLSKIENVGSWAKDISSKVVIQKKKEKVDLVIRSVADLGFPISATRKEIYDAALKQGLFLCPAEVGLQLAANYKDQPKGEWLLIAMEPITGSGGRLVVFHVERDDDSEQWLDGNYGHPDRVWLADRRWVFMRKDTYPNALPTPDGASDKVLSNIEKTDTCWIWKGATSKGYGTVKYKGKQFTTHRIVFETLVQKVPKGFVLDHLCSNRNCVNPDHMAIVTNRENVQRGWDRGRTK